MRSQMRFNQLKRGLHHIPGLRIRETVPIAPMTTLKVGGTARLHLSPDTPEALSKALAILQEYHVTPHIIGKGSNLIVSDKGLQCVVDTTRLNWFSRLDQETLEVGAGMPLKRLIPMLVKLGLSGLETLAGIPGSIGGAIAMNAGACGVTMGEHLKEVLLVGKDTARWVSSKELSFGYRKVGFPTSSENVVVGGARLRLKQANRNKIRMNIKRVIRKRIESQPLGARSAGCIFKNPKGHYAGALIEKSGFKGMVHGGAMVSRKHANFIVNLGKAKATHFLHLMERIRDKVYKDHGVELEPEVKIIGTRF